MHLPIIVCGGGIVGLLTLREIHHLYPNLDMALLEAGPFFGDQASGRNSGVLHGGLYYPADSLKRKFCLEGNLLWEPLAKELNIPFERCGKFLVASSEEEVPSLKELFNHANIHGVQGLRWATEAEKEKLLEYCSLSEAFFSPQTGILSPSECTKAAADDLFKKDIPLMKDYRVEKIVKERNVFKITTNREEFTCDIFINAAGGFAPDLRKTLGLEDVTSYWVKGNYLKLNRSFYTDSLIYPVPPKGLKGLGVHTSFDFDRVVRFGPDTEDCHIGYEHSLSEDIVEKMYPAIKTLFKGIQKEDLAPDYCGIRSKIKVKGELYSDFILGTPQTHGVDHYYEFLGIESPGLTASPALAKEMAKKITNLSQEKLG